MNHYDVVIVGGAAVGSAAAYFLASAAAFDGTLLVLEQDFGYQRCATTLSVASVRHQFSTPENIRMSMFGSDFVRQAPTQLAVDGDMPDLAWHEGGYLFLASAAGLETLYANHRTQRDLGAEVQLLGPETLHTRFDWLRVNDLAGASLGQRGEGWLDAYALMMALRRKAIALGARYRQARVTQLLRSGSRVQGVVLADGTHIGCGTLINAAGIGAAALASSAGIDLPVQPRKRCVFHVHSPARTPGCPLVIDPTGVYFRPEGGGWLCGVAPPEHEDPACEDFEVQHALFDDVIWPVLAARVEGFEALRVKRAWAGHYDVNVLDHNMILGAHPQIDNLLFANGFSGHGLQHAPAVGRGLSELVLHREFRTLDLSRLGWARVQENRPLFELNVV
jgi:FAD-dependent oxidoreductase domain-containing protein 1